MQTFLEELQHYFETIPREKVVANWVKYDTEENNIGPTVNDFIENYSYYKFSSHSQIDTGTFEIENKNLSPEFSPGFLFANNFIKSINLTCFRYF